jgi:hypothetical protein
VEIGQAYAELLSVPRAGTGADAEDAPHPMVQVGTCGGGGSVGHELAWVEN